MRAGVRPTMSSPRPGGRAGGPYRSCRCCGRRPNDLLKVSVTSQHGERHDVGGSERVVQEAAPAAGVNCGRCAGIRLARLATATLPRCCPTSRHGRSLYSVPRGTGYAARHWRSGPAGICGHAPTHGRVNKTDIKVRGDWAYLCRAVGALVSVWRPVASAERRGFPRHQIIDPIDGMTFGNFRQSIAQVMLRG